MPEVSFASVEETLQTLHYFYASGRNNNNGSTTFPFPRRDPQIHGFHARHLFFVHRKRTLRFFLP